jgi:Uma2 family endonuclease
MTSRATDLIDALHRVPEGGKAEIVNGELVLMSPTGSRPGRAAQRIFVSLDAHERHHGGGHAYADNIGFLVDLPNRQSFSPDAAWYVGVIDTMGFLNGAPRLAVEVRSESDYGPAAEKTLAQKRADYFAAGTKVVWDVDILSNDVVRVYRARDPDNPTVYRRGDTAEAEPAVPGWRMSVDELFD